MTAFGITIPISGARKNWTLMVIGFTPTITAGSGGRTLPSSTTTTTGRLIATGTGRGARHTAGPGWDRSHGVGRLITTAAGSITTTIGAGVRASAINIGAGGDRRSWLFSRSTSTLVQRSAGTRFRTISAIRAPVTTSDPIAIRDDAEMTMMIGDDAIQPTGER